MSKLAPGTSQSKASSRYSTYPKAEHIVRHTCPYIRICNPKFKSIILSPCWWPVSVQASSWHEPIDVKLMFIMPVIPRENYLLRIVTLLRQPLYKPYLFGACLYAFAQWSKTLYGNRYFYFVSLYLKLLKRFYMYSLSSCWSSRGFRSPYRPYHPYHCLIF